MRQLGAGPPAPPPVETAGETPSEILAHEPDSVEAEEPFRVEVYRLERKPIASKPVDRLQEAEAPQTHSPAEPQVPEPVAPKEKEEAKEETNDGVAPVGSVPELRPHEQYPVEVRAPVEVHRIELNPVEAEPAAQLLRITETPDIHSGVTSPAAAIPKATKVEEKVREGPKEAVAPLGRWEEFREPDRSKSGRGDRIHLERVPLQQGFSSRLLTADLEREPRSPFLILAVLGIGVALVVGALWWRGWIPTRLKQPDAAMIALQEQNRKLADTLAQMKRPADATNAPQNSTVLQQPKTAQEEHPAQSGQPGSPVHRSSQSGRLQGVSVPPPMQSAVHGQRRSSTPQKGSLYDRPPEIVPPYPTLAQSQNTGANAAGSQPAPNPSGYHEPFTPGAYQQPVAAAGATHPGMSPGTTSRTAVPPVAAAPKPPPSAASNNGSSPALTLSNGTQYDAGIGSYANLLAQNIETVEGLQRHSAVQLREFHARAGVPTQATRTVQLSVQHPDQSSGSYALVVAEGGSSYQLRGEVNVPLGFADTATHRRYGLVILSIAGQQVYGYVRAMQ
jgi:hypothetical protein